MSDSTITGRIFIAGTGRSGTTRLAQLLGSHKRIYCVKNEARFLTDPDGLQDLIDALSSRYTIYHADQALKRFDLMMRETLVGLKENAFKSWHLDKNFGQELYFTRLNKFISDLVDYEFDEQVPVDSLFNPDRHYWPSQSRSYRRVVGKYFRERENIIGLCRNFVDDLFGSAAIAGGKDFWCEKTPLNLLNIPFLWELFPSSKIVHIKRDPRGVAYSLTQQTWAPGNIADAIKILIPIYDRWQTLKNSIELPADRYIEIKSETFFTDCRNQSGLLLDWLGAGSAEMDMVNISSERIDSWRNKIAPADLALCNRHLSPYISLMGYDDL
ncbi:MAG TPA: sulfotransferase [Sideroxyarcus sp.]|nr:sulfotransferase [Sideroxyarcus sp.]